MRGKQVGFFTTFGQCVFFRLISHLVGPNTISCSISFSCVRPLLRTWAREESTVVALFRLYVYFLLRDHLRVNHLRVTTYAYPITCVL